jgi:pyruvate dehydrogenase E2 component (dihydrolipoamide acetyltransferase)
MTIEITMPALSPTMTEGTLAKWLKKEGDMVVAGDVIAEIETDKATMEVEAAEEGKLARILVAEGTEGVAVNAPIALLLEEDEDESVLASAPAPAAAPAVPAQPAAPERTVATPAAPSPGVDAERIFASPLARRMAAQAGLDLASIAGSGPHGRIIKIDIDAIVAGDGTSTPAPAPAKASPTPSSPTPDEGMPPFEDIPHSGMRKVLARRLAESKREAPHFYLTVDCEIDTLLGVRRDLNARVPTDSPDAYKLSVNDFVIRAAALALMKVPVANASWTDAAVRRYKHADISVAVALDDGLITPVIRGADGKGLATISREMKDLAARARAGKLALDEYRGGTFSISNLGMYGVREFAAVINPPQGAILAVGAGAERAVVKDGALAIATVMSCTLSVDHRAVDGAVGAELMAAFRALIEDPLRMLL